MYLTIRFRTNVIPQNEKDLSGIKKLHYPKKIVLKYLMQQ